MDPQEKLREFHFYVDDSGSRDPDRSRASTNQEPDWFALGGVLVDSADKAQIDERLKDFRARWPALGNLPLRSYNIRNRTEQFKWLQDLATDERDRFYSAVTDLICGSPMRVLACVVDRPGYNRRYLHEYGPRRWLLCRTAFNIAVERAAKFAQHFQARLRVFVERCDKPTEERLRHYYEEMRTVGLPFSAATSAKYAPLSAEQLKSTLFEFRVKTKSSGLMQMADVVLWPVCRGGYDPDHRNFQDLRMSGLLLDSECTKENGLLGVKYSCFDEPNNAGATEKTRARVMRALGGHQTER